MSYVSLNLNLDEALNWIRFNFPGTSSGRRGGSQLEPAHLLDE
ncbi:MAG: hypothetical protein WAV67_01360 [Dokdonella sp.]